MADVAERGEVMLTLHGLDVDSGDVRAEVFIAKFRTLISGLLQSADREVNRNRFYHYVIVDLNVGHSATAKVRERIARMPKRHEPLSSVRYVGEAVRRVYNGDSALNLIPLPMLYGVAALTKDAGSTFSHGELGFEDNNVIRIDDYLADQAQRAIRRIEEGDRPERRYFEGVAYETFDGVIKEIDARGTLVRGKLILTAGGKEIDCVFNSIDIPSLRQNFNRRVRAEGIVHYNGQSLLPTRMDVKRIHPAKEDADLIRWRGMLTRQLVDVDEAEDEDGL